MTLAPRDQLRTALARDEGFRTRPYLDCCGLYWRDCTCVVKGKLTIGVGRNLDDDGLRPSEIYQMLDNDIDAAIRDCSTLPVFGTLDSVRQGVLTQMAFNLGLAKLRGFPQMLAALARGDYADAAKQMLQSKWAAEVKGRAARLAAEMETGAIA